MPFHCARGAFSRNEEPTLDNLLAEPAVRVLMAKDQVEEAEVRGLAAEVGRRLLGPADAQGQALGLPFAVSKGAGAHKPLAESLPGRARPHGDGVAPCAPWQSSPALGEAAMTDHDKEARERVRHHVRQILKKLSDQKRAQAEEAGRDGVERDRRARPKSAGRPTHH